MEVSNYPRSSNTLSIAGLALSVLAFVIALIPCFGMLAFIPALLGLIFAIIGLSQADKHRTPKSIALVGIVMGSTALLIAGVWTGIISSFASHSEYRLEQKVERIINNIGEEFRDTDVRIQIEENRLSEEDLEYIREEAGEVGDVVEKVIAEILEGIHSVQIEGSDKRLIITIPRNGLSNDDIEELRQELYELEIEIRQLVKGFSIQLETENEDGPK